jgi:hypothetical protein
MDPKTHFRTLSFNHDFGFKEYVTPSVDCDPKRQILYREWDDYKHKHKQGKFKVTTKPRVCYFDELAKPAQGHPGSARYKVEGNMLARSKSTSLKKILVDPNAKKRTYIDNIEQEVTKHKPPGVGKFDLTRYTAFVSKKGSPARDMKEQIRTKSNLFDNCVKLAAELPGPG